MLRNKVVKPLLIALTAILPFKFVHAVETSTESAALSVNYPGLTSVHTEIRLTDATQNSASGAYIGSHNWKSHGFTATVPAEILDLIIRKGSATYYIDDLDCSSGSCSVDDIVATLSVTFDGMSSVHIEARLPDGLPDEATGGSVNNKNWQSNQASFAVLRQIYDVRMRRGSDSFVVDNVDCQSGSCSVDDQGVNMIVNFPGVSSVHSDVRIPDAVPGAANGGSVTSSNWKSNQTTIRVFPKIYDLRIRKGAATHIIDNLDCRSGDCEVEDFLVDLDISFPGLSSVHSDVRLPDNNAETATGDVVTSSNWKRDATNIRVFPALYDLRIRQGASTHIVNDVDCSNGDCQAGGFVRQITVGFQGLSSVHTDVYPSDGINSTVSSSRAARSYWKTNSTTINTLPGLYDLKIRQGSGEYIIDNVDCRTANCETDDFVTTMNVEFNGLSSVHTEVYPYDGAAGSTTGSRITGQYWKTDSASVSLFPGIYDVKITRGGSTHIVDSVDCLTGGCSVGNLTTTLSVGFDGMSSVHTEVYPTDDTAGSVSGSKAAYSYWKNNSASVSLFPGIYDVKLRKGNAFHIIDNVDCSSGPCDLGEQTAMMDVEFPGLSSVHTSIHMPDDIAGEAGGGSVTTSNWKSNSTSVKVFPQLYDVKLRKGGASYIADGVDCTAGSCLVNNVVATLEVGFDGLSSVHTDVRVPDDIAGAADGDMVTSRNWQSNSATITTFRQNYDLRIRKGASTQVVDGVDCTSGSCSVGGLVTTLTVNFDGLSSVHTDVRLPDGEVDNANGETVTSKNWQSNSATLKLFPQFYDLRIRKGGATFVVDQVDCTGPTCSVVDITATINVDFEGLSSVHTDVRLPDGEVGRASGDTVTSKNWQSNNASITAFRQIYDLRLRKGSSTHVVDGVDCTSGNCSVAGLVSTMHVEFPGMSSVHTDIRVPDDEAGSAGGSSVTSSNWRTNGTDIKLFPGIYDVRLRKGESSHIVDDVDCRADSCTVDNLVSTLTVNFDGLSSVHTDVRVPDDNLLTAEGGQVTNANWKTDKATVTVFPQFYDLRIRKGHGTLFVDNVDCREEICEVNDLTANLVVRFPGLTSVHTDVRVADGVDDSAIGGSVIKANWKNQLAEITVLRLVYDLHVNHGNVTLFDDVNCESGACEAEVAGNLQVTLMDGDTNSPIIGKYVKAYEKLPDTTLVYTSNGTTNAEGKIHFTLPGIDSKQVYVLKAWNPLGEGENYYSPFLTATGPFQFIISRTGNHTLDLTAPVISLDAPVGGSNVSLSGFLVSGLATDNRSVDTVNLNVSSGGTSTVIAAVYNPTTSVWSAQVPASLLTANVPVDLIATATDPARNATDSTMVSVTPIVDNQGPVIAFTSHADNASVPVTGFLLSGTVTDLTGITSLTASLMDQASNPVFTDQSVDYSLSSGIWTLAVTNGQVVEGELVSITMNAIDVDGNPASELISLNVVAVSHAGWQLLNRTTFGITPQLLQGLAVSGVDTFIDEQLDPVNMIPDDGLAGVLSMTPPATTAELQEETLLRMIFSNHQLLEVMTWFWDNHFNTDIRTMRMNANGMNVSDTVAFELAENQAFRGNALGNFGDLLEASAKSPSMLIYLDSISNVVGDSNENYPREVMELSSLGVEDGSTTTQGDTAYSEADVAAAAEVFTGWHIQNDAFFFDATQHNFTEQTILGQLIPAGGVEQGEQLINILATHPSTAYYLCTKLTQLLVDDVPPMPMVDRCATTFLANISQPDQMAQVLRTILSNEFFDIVHYRNKIKTPVDLIVGALRNLGATSDASDLTGPMGSMGLSLYMNPVPTGYSEIGDDWINSSLLIERIKWANVLSRQTSSGNGSSIEPLIYFPGFGFETADGIVGFLLNITMGDDFTDEMRSIAVNMLQGVNGFDINDADADDRLRQVIGVILSYPNYQFQ